MYGGLLLTDEAFKSAAKVYRFARPEQIDTAEESRRNSLIAVGGTAVRRCSQASEQDSREAAAEVSVKEQLNEHLLMDELPIKPTLVPIK